MPDGGGDVVGAILTYATAGVSPEETCADLGLVLGWRVWRAEPDRLGSFVFDTEWPHRRALVAQCPMLTKSIRPLPHEPHGGPVVDLFGVSLHESREHAPGFACRCGIHAASARGDLPTASLDRRWIGPVALWGTVIEHQRGYRASHAYPLRLEETSASKVLDGIGAVSVLFIEADAVIRRLGADMLRDRGCRVLEAADGALALALLRQCPEQIDVLLMGTTQSGPDARALIEDAARFRPEIRVVANSGRFLVASLDGRPRAVAAGSLGAINRFDHPLARAYGVPVIASCA